MGGTADTNPSPAGAPMTGPERALRVNAVTSSLRIRPLGPEPVTSPRSTPSSRAKRRTDGLACTRLPRTTSADGSAGGGLGSAGAAGSAGVGATAGGLCSAGGVGTVGAGAAAGEVLAVTMRAALSATGAFCAPPAVFSGTGAADAPPADLSASVRITAPSEILSPTLTWMDWTVPA